MPGKVSLSRAKFQGICPQNMALNVQYHFNMWNSHWWLLQPGASWLLPHHSLCNLCGSLRNLQWNGRLHQQMADRILVGSWVSSLFICLCVLDVVNPNSKPPFLMVLGMVHGLWAYHIIWDSWGMFCLCLPIVVKTAVFFTDLGCTASIHFDAKESKSIQTMERLWPVKGPIPASKSLKCPIHPNSRIAWRSFCIFWHHIFSRFQGKEPKEPMGFPGVILLFIHPGFVYKDEGNCRLGAGPSWVLSMGVLQSENHGKLHGRAGCFFWGTMTKRTPPIGNQH